jgi:hypothetical protein
MGKAVGERGGLMHSGPSKTAEAIVAVFVPPACRQEVLGDLHERYRSSCQYGLDALRTIPLVIISRIRRTADPQVLLMQAVALYASFLGAAWLKDRAFLSAQWGLLRLAIPAGMAMLGLILEDTYAKPGRRSPLNLARGPVLGLGLALASQDMFRIGNPDLAVPSWITFYGCAISLLLSSAVRMLFPPATGQLQGANVPADWLKQTRKRIMNSKAVTIIFAVLICVAGILWIATAGHQSVTTLTYSQFLEKVQTGQIASVVVEGSNSNTIQAIYQLKDGTALRTVLPSDYRDAMVAMLGKKVNVEIWDSSSGYLRLFIQFTPFFLCVAVWIFLVIRKGPNGRFILP